MREEWMNFCKSHRDKKTIKQKNNKICFYKHFVSLKNIKLCKIFLPWINLR